MLRIGRRQGSLPTAGASERPCSANPGVRPGLCQSSPASGTLLSFSCYPWALYLLPMDVVDGLLRLLLA